MWTNCNEGNPKIKTERAELLQFYSVIEVKMTHRSSISLEKKLLMINKVNEGKKKKKILPMNSEFFPALYQIF